jgi:hypothetical protein
MGVCRAACDGGESMADYRAGVERACQFAAGDRDSAPRQVTEEMRQLAAGMQFEKAAVRKSALKQLTELQAGAFAHVGPAEEFRYLLVQHGGARKLQTLLVDRGAIALGPALDQPVGPAQAAEALAAMAAFIQPDRPVGELERWGIALVSQYIFGNPQRRGVILRYRRDLNEADVVAAIDAAAVALGQKFTGAQPKGRIKDRKP